MIITLAHTKGGVGKSTAAWHLAHAFKQLGKVEIVDIDFNQTLHYINMIAGNPFIVHQPRNISELYELISRTTHDVTLVMDIGGFDSDLNRAAIRHSDHVVIPITPDRVTEVLGFRTFDSIRSYPNSILSIRSFTCCLITSTLRPVTLINSKRTYLAHSSPS